MSQPDDRHDEPGQTALGAAPVTGEAAVDRALLALAELDAAPLTEHPGQLARAHERLHEALNRDGS